MDSQVVKLTEFVRYVRTYLPGDEKGEAQIFCDRLMQAFGHRGILEAGGALEYRVHQGKSTRFADLLSTSFRMGCSRTCKSNVAIHLCN